jgi:hypothetical protein
MAAINDAGLVSKSYPVRDTLFFKLQGTPTAIKETATAVQQIVKKYGSKQFEFASTDAEAAELWENRKYALMSTMTAGGEGARVWTTDVWSVHCSLRCDKSSSLHSVFLFRDCLSLYTKQRKTWKSLA